MDTIKEIIRLGKFIHSQLSQRIKPIVVIQESNQILEYVSKVLIYSESNDKEIKLTIKSTDDGLSILNTNRGDINIDFYRNTVYVMTFKVLDINDYNQIINLLESILLGTWCA